MGHDLLHLPKTSSPPSQRLPVEGPDSRHTIPANQAFSAESTFHIPSSRSELPAVWDHFGDLEEMILAAPATVETGYARLLEDLLEIHNGLLLQAPL